MHPDDTRRDDEGAELDPASPGDEGGPGDLPEPAEAPEAEPSPGRRQGLPTRGLDILSLDEFEDDDDDDDDGFPDDDEEFDDEDEVRTILVTGATGRVARTLLSAWRDLYDFVLIDQDADPAHPEVIAADLSVMDEGWITHFHGVDTVLHLSGTDDENAPWEALQGPNLDALANVLHASALAGVERIVFASSTHVMGGYKALGGEPITADLPPMPDGPASASKLVGERLGRSLAAAFDVTFIALRLGGVPPGPNRPESLHGDWARGMWLSDGDLVRLFECAVEADLDDNQFVVVNGVSNNRGTRWDLAAAADLLGYSPEDDSYAGEA